MGNTFSLVCVPLVTQDFSVFVFFLFRTTTHAPANCQSPTHRLFPLLPAFSPLGRFCTLGPQSSGPGGECLPTCCSMSASSGYDRSSRSYFCFGNKQPLHTPLLFPVIVPSDTVHPPPLIAKCRFFQKSPNPTPSLVGARKAAF